jgi:hypothetical protein
MSQHVLIVFAGTRHDPSLACTLVGLATHFRRDPTNEVTVWSTIDLEPIIPPDGFVFGRKEGHGDRLMVLSRFAHTHRPRPYDLVAENIKQRILDWVHSFHASPAQVPPQSIAVCFVCHGNDLGELVLGEPSDPNQILRPSELYAQLNSLDATTKASVLLCSCYTGVWVENAIRLSTHPNLIVHSACKQDQEAWPLRSTSNKYRCSLFGAAVAEALDQELHTTAAGYEIMVAEIMDEATHHVSHPSTPHEPAMSIDEAKRPEPISSALGLATLPRKRPRSLLQSQIVAGASLARSPTSQGLTAFSSVSYIAEILDAGLPVPMTDTAFWSLLAAYPLVRSGIGPPPSQH